MAKSMKTFFIILAVIFHPLHRPFVWAYMRLKISGTMRMWKEDIGKAKQYYDSGEYNTALSHLHHSLENSMEELHDLDEFIEILLFAAEVCLCNGDKTKAEYYLTLAKEKGGELSKENEFFYCLHMGTLERDRCDYKLAYQHYQNARDILSYFPSSELQELVDEHLDTLKDANPKHAKMVTKATEHVGQDHYQAALSDYLDIIRETPENNRKSRPYIEALLNCGELYRLLSNYREAEKYLAEADSLLSPENSFRIMLNLYYGNLRADQQRFKEAEGYYQRCGELLKDSPESPLNETLAFNLKSLYREMGKAFRG